jgi:hypothetical protein
MHRSTRKTKRAGWFMEIKFKWFLNSIDRVPADNPRKRQRPNLAGTTRQLPPMALSACIFYNSVEAPGPSNFI